MKKLLGIFATLFLLIFTTPSLSIDSDLAKMVMEIGGGDIDKGLGHLQKLSKEGNSTATFILADLLFQEKQIKSAHRLFVKSAELDHPIAMKFLATGYFKGAFGEKDYEKARYWYEKSAKFKNINSMVYLGFIYRDGLGVSKDLKTAYLWFTIASILKPNVSGHKEPEDFANELAPYLTESQISNTKRSAKTWISQHAKNKKKPPGIPPIKSER